MAGAKIADRLAMRPIHIELDVPGAGPATGTLPIPLASLVLYYFPPLLSLHPSAINLPSYMRTYDYAACFL